jgi:hypothetical protein
MAARRRQRAGLSVDPALPVGPIGRFRTFEAKG